MGKKKKTIKSQEVGLEIGLIFFKYFLKTEYLHYGLFTDGLETDVQNLGKAQENYAEMIFDAIPDGVETILDVGCGSGKTAQQLVARGYKVECVSPSKLLNEYARNLLGDSAPVHTAKFEEVKLGKKFDLVLFSESFQYIAIEDAMEHALNYLNPNGHIIVSDFFKTDAPGKSALGGGHKFAEWEEQKPKYPLKTIIERDITKETAPTIDLVHTMTRDVIHPIWTLLLRLAEDRYPKLLKLVKWKFRKKLDKMEKKHFRGERNGANFIKYKKYMFYLFQVQK